MLAIKSFAKSNIIENLIHFSQTSQITSLLMQIFTYNEFRQKNSRLSANIFKGGGINNFYSPGRPQCISISILQ